MPFRFGSQAFRKFRPAKPLRLPPSARRGFYLLFPCELPRDMNASIMLALVGLILESLSACSAYVVLVLIPHTSVCLSLKPLSACLAYVVLVLHTSVCWWA